MSTKLANTVHKYVVQGKAGLDTKAIPIAVHILRTCSDWFLEASRRGATLEGTANSCAAELMASFEDDIPSVLKEWGGVSSAREGWESAEEVFKHIAVDKISVTDFGKIKTFAATLKNESVPVSTCIVVSGGMGKGKSTLIKAIWMSIFGGNPTQFTPFKSMSPTGAGKKKAASKSVQPKAEVGGRIKRGMEVEHFTATPSSPLANLAPECSLKSVVWPRGEFMYDMLFKSDNMTVSHLLAKMFDMDGVAVFKTFVRKVCSIVETCAGQNSAHNKTTRSFLEQQRQRVEDLEESMASLIDSYKGLEFKLREATSKFEVVSSQLKGLRGAVKAAGEESVREIYSVVEFVMWYREEAVERLLSYDLMGITLPDRTSFLNTFKETGVEVWENRKLLDQSSQLSQRIAVRDYLHGVVQDIQNNEKPVCPLCSSEVHDMGGMKSNVAGLFSNALIPSERLEEIKVKNGWFQDVTKQAERELELLSNMLNNNISATRAAIQINLDNQKALTKESKQRELVYEIKTEYPKLKAYLQVLSGGVIGAAAAEEFVGDLAIICDNASNIFNSIEENGSSDGVEYRITPTFNPDKGSVELKLFLVQGEVERVPLQIDKKRLSNGQYQSMSLILEYAVLAHLSKRPSVLVLDDAFLGISDPATHTIVEKLFENNPPAVVIMSTQKDVSSFKKTRLNEILNTTFQYTHYLEV
jgi:hypothetical protein